MARIEYGTTLSTINIYFSALRISSPSRMLLCLTNSRRCADFSFWFYIPNKGAAIFFTLAFLFSTVLHYWQCQ